MLAVFLGCQSHCLFELSIKVRQIVIPALKGNFGYGQSGSNQFFTDNVYSVLCQIVYGTDSHCFFKTEHEIAFAEMEQGCQLLHIDLFGKMCLYIFQCRAYQGTVTDTFFFFHQFLGVIQKPGET